MRVNFKGLWLLPSFYGLLAWLIALAVLALDLVYVNRISLEGCLVISYVLLVFFAMSFVFFAQASSALQKNRVIDISRSDWIIFVITSLLGVAGLLKYIYDFSLLFGGFREFFFVFLTSALDIRGAATETQSIGFQFSYFSWISIFFGLYLLVKTEMSFVSRTGVFLLVVLEIILNFTFIDRTRPTWLFITCVLGIYFSRDIRDIKIWRTIIYIGAFPSALFLIFALMSGKYDADFGIFQTMFAYIVGGLGYLDSLISAGGSYDYLPIRTFYPISKVLEGAGFIASTPSQVLESRYIPFDTNVGTFVEPLLSDGGILFVLIGVPMLLFVVNYVSLKCFVSKSIFGLFVWSNLVFVMLISFFVPKFNSTPIYLFCGLFVFLKMLPLRSK